MKTLAQFKEVYEPKSADEKKFKDKHVTVKHKLDAPSNDDKVFQATNIKVVDREPEHGYNSTNDAKVYEALTVKDTADRKTVIGKDGKKYKVAAHAVTFGKNEKNDMEEELSPEQMKKREGIVKGMKKSIGDFRSRYGKQAKSVMYATANKLAKEDVDQDEESMIAEANAGAQNLYKMHHDRIKTLLKGIGEGLDKHKKNAGQNMHYGHAGDLKYVANQLQDVHDSLHMQGEYAKPPRVGGEEFLAKLDAIYEQLDDEGKAALNEMIDNDDLELIEQTFLTAE